MSVSKSKILKVQFSPLHSRLKCIDTELTVFLFRMSPMCCSSLTRSLFLVCPTYILLHIPHSIAYINPDDLHVPDLV